MLKKPTLAIIEDNLDLQEELSFFLEAKGYNCWFAASAEEFWKELHLQKADIFLIDIGLPGEDGFSLIKHLIRLGDFGLIVITARGGKQDYLQGLSLGADLYLVKPVNFSDLNDKLESLWQRMQVARQEASLETSENFAVDYKENDKRGWLLDKVDCCLVEPKGCKLDLTQQEKDLLELLLQQPNQIISRSYINDTLFKHLENNDVHRVDVIVSRLRKKAKAWEFYLPLRSVFGKGLAFIINE
ncbi:MAG TPA: response regulator transcription factor [Marinospirillum sp.]|uniref:response regulator transcription factor n=1 Tax=Marinospirillum sp. TaxID=2183934 RepID=UPI002B4A641F|nr:response regulator transcription factor [Marinospirillum sp.]HKM15316.1 response regulator transcription factor [Marinospirillum sp.]